ncbi:MAG TPA: DUF1636 domain-containing protein [Candidatus Obscuribacterales bacterium]
MTLSPRATLFVCSLCRFSETERTRGGLSGGEHLIQQLQAELHRRQLTDAVQLTPLRCMAGCSQPCNVSLAAPDKLTFILSHVSPTEAAATVTEFCQQYVRSVDGRVPYKERPAAIRAATAFVLPPLPAAPSSHP